MGQLGMAEKQKNPATRGGGCRRVRRLDSGVSDGDWP